MTTKSKQRGTETETMVVRYLRQTWPEAERRILAGANDKGDVINIPLTCLEIKGDRSNRIAAWQAETIVEARNAGSKLHVLVVRVPFKGVRNWDWWMPLDDLGHPLTVDGERPWVRMSVAAGVKLLERLITLHSL